MHLAGHGEKHDEESVKAGNEAETNNDVETKQVKQNNIAEDGNGNKIDGDGEGGGGNIDDDSLEEKKPNEKPDVKKPDQIENPQDDNGEDDGNGDGDDNVDSKGDGDGKRDGNGDHDANGDGDGDGGVNGDGGGKGEGEGDNKPDVKTRSPMTKIRTKKRICKKGREEMRRKILLMHKLKWISKCLRLQYWHSQYLCALRQLEIPDLQPINQHQWKMTERGWPPHKSASVWVELGTPPRILVQIPRNLLTQRVQTLKRAREESMANMPGRPRRRLKTCSTRTSRRRRTSRGCEHTWRSWKDS